MYLHSAELACEQTSPGLSGSGAGKKLSPSFSRPPLERSRELDRRLGGAKLNGSDRECKYFAVGMNPREPVDGHVLLIHLSSQTFNFYCYFCISYISID